MKNQGEYSDFFERFWEFVGDSEGLTEEELDDDLRILGFDPKKLESRISIYVEQQVKKEEVKLRLEKAREQRNKLLEKLKSLNLDSLGSKSREWLTESILNISAKKPAAVELYYRNREELDDFSDNELAAIAKSLLLLENEETDEMES